ncbi:DUF5320 domain-containing protein [Candidatus Wolfebacteria bacterium]|nr:DUF5320 domain-containing protein [Candidatus Wolfebacteria bacterium]
MPRHDGTGPLGYGPGTGRGLGPCGGGRARGRGFGRGLGFGLRRNGNFNSVPNLTKEEEAQALSQEASLLEEDLKAINDRLTELKKEEN